MRRGGEVIPAGQAAMAFDADSPKPTNRRPHASGVRQILEVFILGYPFPIELPGYPVWKRGRIASEPDLASLAPALGSSGRRKVKFGAHPRDYLLADTASRPGMSGAPVIRRRRTAPRRCSIQGSRSRSARRSEPPPARRRREPERARPEARATQAAVGPPAFARKGPTSTLMPLTARVSAKAPTAPKTPREARRITSNADIGTS
jgi:hypothetical protein